jgi:endonuclease/exonuclease/phosphatase family metal-dependent hydrolase
MFSFRFILVATLACLFSNRVWADKRPDKLVIATWNLEWFFDDNPGDNFSKLSKKLTAPSKKDWEWKRDQVATAIAKMQPTILALQEVENQQVLYYLCQRLRNEHNLNYRIAFVLGADFYTEQDVAILYRTGMVEFGRKLQSNEQFGDKKLYNISKHQWARFRWSKGAQTTTLTMFNLHLRASASAAAIRQRQARLGKAWLDEERQREANLIVLGDFNSGERTPAAADSEIGIFSGRGDPAPDDDLVDLHTLMANDERATHMIGAQFDRILVSPNLLEPKQGETKLVLSRVRVRRDLAIQGKPDSDHRDGYYEIPEAERDLSDHYPIVAEFVWR